MSTYLIVPAWSDQAGQCRIVRHAHFDEIRKNLRREHNDPLRHYRAFPDEWVDVGLMASNGHIRCLTAPVGVLEDMRNCEPLMAGAVFQYEEH